MYCAQCGKELPQNASACPACGFALHGAPSTPPGGDSVDQVLSETKRAARELAEASARLSKRLVVKAQTAAKDPGGSAKRAAHRVAKELDAAAHEIDRILKDL